MPVKLSVALHRFRAHGIGVDAGLKRSVDAIVPNESSGVTCNWIADRYKAYEDVLHPLELGVRKHVRAGLGHEHCKRWVRFKAFNLELFKSLA